MNPKKSLHAFLLTIVLATAALAVRSGLDYIASHTEALVDSGSREATSAGLARVPLAAPLLVQWVADLRDR